jgi:hypothetical protein
MILLMLIEVCVSMYQITLLFFVMFILPLSPVVVFNVSSHTSSPDGVMTHKTGYCLFSSNKAVVTAMVFEDDFIISLAVFDCPMFHRSVPSRVKYTIFNQLFGHRFVGKSLRKYHGSCADEGTHHSVQ